MKKLFIMAATALLFGACSQEEIPGGGNLTPDTDGKAHQVEVNLNISLSDGLDTRAGRPLNSSENKQAVTDVAAYIFKYNSAETSKKYELVQAVEVKNFDTDPNDGKETHSYMLELTNGKYKILAVGLDAGKSCYLGTNTPLTNVIAIGSDLETAVLTLSGEHAAEAFSGVDAKEYEVTDDTKSFTSEVIMKRAVAGVLGYFTHVPYELIKEGDTEPTRVTNICVELITKGLSVKTTDWTKVTQQSNSAADVTTNGYYRILDIAVSGGRSDNGNYITKTASVSNGVSILADSWLQGGYVLPFSHIGTANTMVVRLYNKNSETGSYTLLKEYPVHCTSGAGHTNATYFDINANELYSLGVKPLDDNRNPDKPTDPVDPTKPDDPLDLSKEDIIKVTVDPTWGTFHKLGI